ncbi:hypothetical protein P3T76_004422 [Phytophthora citrophthora]|uniref:Uncharacterized protein n=1 Tax=Phytophthora citrophthora TaxID=4793 RepID=A0AAD9LP88_9STRA|nr:hypothetical protein P3T76_004422 [Phytophthora citrophthora]
MEAKTMHVHFANMSNEGLTDVGVSNGNFFCRKDRGPWIPTCQFPAIEEDVLLYLAVLGGKKSAYCNHNKPEEYSAASIFQESNEDLTLENTSAPCNDFSKFENMVIHALFCASRRNGVRGITFNNFFSNLLGEFQNKEFQRVKIVGSKLMERYEGLKEKFAGMVIPFLAPPNAR